MIQIPDKYESSLSTILSMQIMALEQILRLDEYQMLEMLDKMHSIPELSEMMSSKKAEELLMDIQIKELLTNTKLSYKAMLDDLIEIKKILDGEVQHSETN